MFDPFPGLLCGVIGVFLAWVHGAFLNCYCRKGHVRGAENDIPNCIGREIGNRAGEAEEPVRNAAAKRTT